jgi:hypothetical protein
VQANPLPVPKIKDRLDTETTMQIQDKCRPQICAGGNIIGDKKVAEKMSTGDGVITNGDGV